MQQFLKALQEGDLPLVFNPWRDSCAFDAAVNPVADRLARLQSHFACPNPLLILVGEAPGYQGARYSGIPFTSERLLLQGAIPRLPPLGHRLSLRQLPFSEPSASIVWRTLYALDIAERTILWNAFPWHPMGAGGIHSNRTPSREELMHGQPVLLELLRLFPQVPLVAVGRQAGALIRELNTPPAAEVRHPARGGATLFSEQLRGFVVRTLTA